jgi:nucleotidyltransferase substrate binding protein (TIGR01987 family)
MSKLDFTSFSNAIDSFGDALNEYAKDETNSYVRDSCIQRFEYCYDMSKKILIKHLKSISDDPMEIDRTSLANNTRRAYSLGIIKHSWDEWDIYRENRNNTSHGYDEGVAINIVQQLPIFYKELVFLLNRLEEYNENQV